jgi:hypothetical protein
MRPTRLQSGVAISLMAGLGLLVLHACQEPLEVAEPSAAVAAVRPLLTVSGAGNGNGTVTSNPAGISCVITGGVAATTGCAARFNKGVVVTLTAAPQIGHAHHAWTKYCSGSTSCKPTMNVSRAVGAQFFKGPFTIKIAGSGTGSGRITSQPGLSPAINCLITNGVAPTGGGCRASYPAYTALTLTATPASGSAFSTWGAPCSGAGTCQPPVTKSRTIVGTFAASGPAPEAIEGKWDSPFPTPAVAIHMHLLPTGRVLLWGDAGESHLWDPADPGGGFTQVTKPYQVFCSGHTILPDGRLLVAGGHITSNHGLATATIFDPTTGVWSPTGAMAQGRWYPSTIPLPSGEVLVVAGADETSAMVTTPEVWNGSAWRQLTTAGEVLVPYYPELFVAPNGKVFMAGESQTTRYLDVGGTGEWTTVADRNVADRFYGAAVMYAPGKILYAGGGQPPTSSAEVIDLNQASPSWRSVPGMAFPRRQLLATVLADGKVLVTHGTSGTGFNNQNTIIHHAELWDPATESWSTMARESGLRAYHATAVLLPDGRVLSSGSGEGGGVCCANNQLTAQVFSPPYLFDANGTLAARPTIGSAPATLAYGQSFTVGSPEAGSVVRGTLIRLSSATHTTNQSQHIYPLTFTAAGASSLVAQAPASADLAPPGPYMLFLVNDEGVPSVAKIVRVGS